MFALMLAMFLVDAPKPFESKAEKEAAITAVEKRIAPIQKSLTETTEDMEVAKRATLGANESKPLGNGRFQRRRFKTAEMKAKALAEYKAEIEKLESQLKPLQEELKAIKKRPIVPPKPEKPNDQR